MFLLFPDTSSYPDNFSQTSTPSSFGNLRSFSADRKRHGRDGGEKSLKKNVRSDSQFINVKNVMLSEDSGNCSLNTDTYDSRKSAISCHKLNAIEGNDLWVEDIDIRGRYS